MVEKPIPYASFVNIARFWVVYLEGVVRPMAVCSPRKFPMKRKDIIHKMQRKCRNVLALSFAPQKFPPRQKQVFERDDSMITMAQPPFTLSLSSASILNQIKEGYLLWMAIVPHIPKGARYTIGARIENKFLDLLELSYIAYFTPKERKFEKISECILTLDTLKFLVSVAWEGKLISNKQCEDVALKLDEIGKMFGGWKKSLDNQEKKNRTL